MAWTKRSANDVIPRGRTAPDYVACGSDFTIVLHHHGKFNKSRTLYDGGAVDYFDFCNVDEMSMIEIKEMLKMCDIAVETVTCYFSKSGINCRDLKELVTHIDACGLDGNEGNAKGTYHGGLAMKVLLWKAAKCTRVIDFEETMKEMKDLDEAAYKWLEKKPVEQWSKSHFQTNVKTDICVNNISESFNKMLLDPRGKPIIEMLEDIRMLLMKRICVNRSKADHWWGNLCPLIREKLEFLKQKSNIMTCHYNGLDGFEVELNGGGMDKWIVSVKEKTCSCRKWQLSGYPCVHAISCLSFLGLAVEDYVNECYKRSTYVNVYRHVMQPIKGQNEWPKSNQPILLPPIPEKMPGRPKKNSRKKSSIEMQEIKAKLALEKAAETGRLGRHGITMHCSYCKIAGHNKRNCAKRIAEHGEGSGSSVGAKMNATKKRQLFKEPKETAGPSEQNPKVTKKKTIVMNTTSAITQAVSALKGTKRSRTGQHLDATTSSKFSALTSEGGGVTGTQESVNIWGKEDVGSAQK
ncbi:hypothetical protein OROHE_018854 [Orobanche hederae]